MTAVAPPIDMDERFCRECSREWIVQHTVRSVFHEVKLLRARHAPQGATPTEEEAEIARFLTNRDLDKHRLARLAELERVLFHGGIYSPPRLPEVLNGS